MHKKGLPYKSQEDKESASSLNVSVCFSVMSTIDVSVEDDSGRCSYPQTDLVRHSPHAKVSISFINTIHKQHKLSMVLTAVDD